MPSAISTTPEGSATTAAGPCPRETSRPWLKRRSPALLALALLSLWGNAAGALPPEAPVATPAAAASSGQATAEPPTGPAAPIPLPSARGQELLFQSRRRADEPALAQSYETQANLAYCGVATAVIVLNSLGTPAPAASGYGPYRFWTQTNVFTPASQRWVQPQQVLKGGMNLEQQAGLLASQGLRVRKIPGDQLSLSAFRELLRRSLADPHDRLVANFDRGLVGQQGGGHFSPLAAFHDASDRVLILDTARYRYPASWVRSEDLWRSIRSIDPGTGLSRGLVLVRPGQAAGPP